MRYYLSEIRCGSSESWYDADPGTPDQGSLPLPQNDRLSACDLCFLGGVVNLDGWMNQTFMSM